MRLGQLARKISVRPAEIVNFLSTRGIAIDGGANVKVENDQVDIVVAHFAPGLQIKDEPETEEVREDKPEITEIPATEEIVQGTPLAQTNIEFSEEFSVNPEQPAEAGTVPTPQTPEVIKAQKIELPGLRVIGKIELQSRKKDAAPQQSENVEEEIVPVPEHKKPVTDRKPSQTGARRSEQRPRKNPVSLQREKENREMEERKKEEARREKEKRTQYYLQKVKPAAPVKSASLSYGPVTQLEDETPDAPKTFWGKFMKWLTT